MYNTNNSLMVNVEGMGPTPRTPEILNSLMNMTNPFELSRNARLASSPLSDSTSISNSPPSIQHTCSQLIKEGLKLTIQSKRRNNSETVIQDISTRTTQRPEEVSPESLLGDVSCDGLTPEDEERRRRRRERNKIAATKCRLKKRERTTNLVQESEILETQNHDLKSQIQELENQRRRLVDILSHHGSTCTKLTYQSNSSGFSTEYNRCTTTPSIDGNSSSNFNYNEQYKQLGCETIYQRSSTVSDYRMTTSTSYQNYEEGLMLPYRTEDTDYRSDPVYTNLNVNNTHSYIPPQDSPNSIFRPSSLSLNTSSSDYESNTEIIDSPNVPPVDYNQFDDDPVRYAGFSASSCIS